MSFLNEVISTYLLFWRQGVQTSTNSSETKTQFVDVALSVRKNVEAVLCVRGLPHTSSRTDHPELIILPFGTCNLCDRRRCAADNNKNNNNNKQNIFHGLNNITCGTNCKYITAAKLYTVETWFVSSI